MMFPSWISSIFVAILACSSLAVDVLAQDSDEIKLLEICQALQDHCHYARAALRWTEATGMLLAPGSVIPAELALFFQYVRDDIKIAECMHGTDRCSRLDVMSAFIYVGADPDPYREFIETFLDVIVEDVLADGSVSSNVVGSFLAQYLPDQLLQAKVITGALRQLVRSATPHEDAPSEIFTRILINLTSGSHASVIISALHDIIPPSSRGDPTTWSGLCYLLWHMPPIPDPAYYDLILSCLLELARPRFVCADSTDFEEALTIQGALFYRLLLLLSEFRDVFPDMTNRILPGLIKAIHQIDTDSIPADDLQQICILLRSMITTDSVRHIFKSGDRDVITVVDVVLRKLRPLWRTPSPDLIDILDTTLSAIPEYSTQSVQSLCTRLVQIPIDDHAAFREVIGRLRQPLTRLIRKCKDAAAVFQALFDQISAVVDLNLDRSLMVMWPLLITLLPHVPDLVVHLPYWTRYVTTLGCCLTAFSWLTPYVAYALQMISMNPFAGRLPQLKELIRSNSMDEHLLSICIQNLPLRQARDIANWAQQHIAPHVWASIFTETVAMAALTSPSPSHAFDSVFDIVLACRNTRLPFESFTRLRLLSATALPTDVVLAGHGVWSLRGLVVWLFQYYYQDTGRLGLLRFADVLLRTYWTALERGLDLDPVQDIGRRFRDVLDLYDFVAYVLDDTGSPRRRIGSGTQLDDITAISVGDVHKLMEFVADLVIDRMEVNGFPSEERFWELTFLRRLMTAVLHRCYQKLGRSTVYDSKFSLDLRLISAAASILSHSCPVSRHLILTIVSGIAEHLPSDELQLAETLIKPFYVVECADISPNQPHCQLLTPHNSLVPL